MDVAFVDAAQHGSPGAADLGSFSRPGLGEHGEQHNDPSGGDVGGDTGLLSAEVEASSRSFPSSCRVNGSPSRTPWSTSKSM
jgi:hypothetical protein